MTGFRHYLPFLFSALVLGIRMGELLPEISSRGPASVDSSLIFPVIGFGILGVMLPSLLIAFLLPVLRPKVDQFFLIESDKGMQIDFKVLVDTMVLLLFCVAYYQLELLSSAVGAGVFFSFLIAGAFLYQRERSDLKVHTKYAVLWSFGYGAYIAVLGLMIILSSPALSYVFANVLGIA